jgi:acetoin utilization protein AcuB
MVFYIHDQGMRIQTPVDKLVAQPLRVNAMQRTQAISRQRVEPISGDAAQYQQMADQRERQRAVTAVDIMHRPVISLTSQTAVNEAWILFARHRIHHLPVIDGGRLVGIVSDRDLLRGSLNQGDEKNLRTQTIAEVMSRPVITAAPDTEIRLLAEVMVRQRISVLPVVAEVGEEEIVVGIITRSDLLRVMVDRGPLELWI